MPFFDTEIWTLDQLQSISSSTKFSMRTKDDKNILVAKGYFSNFLDKFSAKLADKIVRQRRLEALKYIRDNILNGYDQNQKDFFTTYFSLQRPQQAKATSLKAVELKAFFESVPKIGQSREEFCLNKVNQEVKPILGEIKKALLRVSEIFNQEDNKFSPDQIFEQRLNKLSRGAKDYILSNPPWIQASLTAIDNNDGNALDPALVSDRIKEDRVHANYIQLKLKTRLNSLPCYDRDYS